MGFRLGDELSLGLGRGASRAGVVAAPVLTWTSDTATAMPTFNIGFALLSVAVGAVITLEIYNDVGLTSLNQTITDTLDQTEKDSGAVNDPGAALTSGTYYARVMITGSPWSNTVTKTLTIASDDNDYAAWAAAA